MKYLYLIPLLLLSILYVNGQCGQVDSFWTDPPFGWPNSFQTVHWLPPSTGSPPQKYQYDFGSYSSSSPKTTSTSADVARVVPQSVTLWVRPICDTILNTYGSWKSYTFNYCYVDPPFYADLSSDYPSCTTLSSSPNNSSDLWQFNGGLYHCAVGGNGSEDMQVHFPPVNLIKNNTYAISFDWTGDLIDDNISFTGFTNGTFADGLPTEGYGTMAREITPGSNTAYQTTLGFRSSGYYAGSGCYYVNNLQIKKATCRMPTNARVTAVTDTTATITWKTPVGVTGASYIIGCGTTTVSGITDSNHTVTGLTPGATYHFSIMNFCSSQGVSAPSDGSFTMPCAPVTLPYTENFGTTPSPQGFPPCTNGDHVGVGHTWDIIHYGAGNNCMRYRYFGVNANAWFYTRGMYLTAGQSYRLNFNYWNGNHSYFFEKLEVKYGLMPYVSGMSNTVVNYPHIDSEYVRHSSTVFTPAVSGVYYLGFHAYSDAGQEYLYVDDISVAEETTLPLNLLSFTAHREGKHNLLQWRTANEVNIDRFEVQRSADGREFLEMENGKLRMENGKHDYSFTDNSPLTTRNYYRLKIVERDGNFTYSPVRMIDNSSDVLVKVYPNPAKEKLQVNIESNQAAQLEMQVLDAVGRVMLSTMWQVNEGGTVKTINLNTLQRGSYYIKLTSPDAAPQMFRFEKL